MSKAAFWLSGLAFAGAAVVTVAPAPPNAPVAMFLCMISFLLALIGRNQ